MHSLIASLAITTCAHAKKKNIMFLSGPIAANVDHAGIVADHVVSVLHPIDYWCACLSYSERYWAGAPEAAGMPSHY